MVLAKESRIPHGDFETSTEVRHQVWAHWPVNWTAIWVGALAALAAIVIFGLVGGAIGAQVLLPEHGIVDLKTIKFGALAFAVATAFFSFVIGGWAAGKVAGILHSEPAMLHGAIVWLVALPLVVLMVTFGAAGYHGAWYSGVASAPGMAARADVARSAADVTGTPGILTKDEAARAARNSALGTVTALLLGFMGSVIGGWMASGEPMTFSPRHRLPSRAAQ